MHQDRFGFMWLGTRDGLNLYDGYQFKVFKNQVGDSTSISGNIIKDIKEDTLGNIWIATDVGLSTYNRGLKLFHNYKLDVANNETPLINVLYITTENKIWVGGNFGLVHFDSKNEEFSSDLMALYDRHPSKKYAVTSITQSDNRQLLLGTSKKGIFQYDVLNKKLKSFHPEEEKNKPIQRVQSLVVTDQEIWAGTYGSGLFKFDTNGNVLGHYHTNALNTQHRISDNRIRTLLIDDHDLWIGTFKGLNVFQDFNQMVTIDYQDGDPKGLSHGSIRSLFKDKKGSIWVGTYFGGVSIYDIHNQRFKHFYNSSGNTNSLSYNVVGAFEVNPDEETIFVGTERGGLNIYDINEKKHHRLVDSSQIRSTIKSLYRDPQYTLWIGVFKKGLHYLNTVTNKLIRVSATQPPEFNYLRDAIINCITADEQGSLWMGTDENGLQKFDYKKKQYIVYPNREALNTLIKRDPIKAIEIKDGLVYLATQGSGIIIFDPALGTIEQLTQFTVGDTSFQCTEFNHISLAKNGKLWLSTNGKGLIAYDSTSKKCNRWHTVSGLGSNIVLGTLENMNPNHRWVITSDMVAEVSLNQDHILRSYSYNTGFPLEEINEGAFYRTKQGFLLIGGSNGYVQFHPDQLSLNTYSPSPVLTALKIFNKDITPGDNSNILTKDISKTSAITLDYFQSVFSVAFRSLNFLRSDHNQYAYMLKGFDSDWVYSQTRNEATYTNLADGKYTFLVKSANTDNVWSATPTSLHITILPPPWKTWWAYCIYVILIGLTMYAIRYNAIKSTQLKNDLRIQQIEKEKWKEIHDLKLKYFIDVSHEFRTPLTLILGPLEEMISSGNQEKWLRSRIKIMYFNAKRLSLLINQILEIREIETGHSQLKEQPLYIEAIIEDIVSSFKVVADKKQIALSFGQPNKNERPVLADKDKIEKVFYNLLSNAFKFTPEGGKIKVTLDVEEHQKRLRYTVKISDTGIGISKNKLDKIFDRFYKGEKKQSGAGIGLSLTKSLVKLMQGDIRAISNKGKGTSFIVNLPFKMAEISLEKEDSAFVKPVPLELQNTPLSNKKKSGEYEKKEVILLVEDNEELKQYLKQQLEPYYTVITAKNGLQGLKKVQREAPDVVISDIMMPKMDGLELCARIKQTKELCHIPVLLLTAKDSQMHKIEGLELGADDYIAKPFSLTELKTRIKNIIKNRNLIRLRFRDNDTLTKPTVLKMNSFDEKLMKQVITIIEEQFDKPNFTVDFLSNEIGLSRVHLSRKIKALTGVGPAEYIKEFKMNYAMDLLKNQAYKIADIAYAVGYQDVQYFSKTFKAKYGQSPANFMKNEKREDK
nr:response regulator [Aquimarina sp. U1-2]